MILRHTRSSSWFWRTLGVLVTVPLQNSQPRPDSCLLRQAVPTTEKEGADCYIYHPVLQVIKEVATCKPLGDW
jgi:hypothetical protein